MIGILAELVNKIAPLILVRFGIERLGIEGYGFTQYGFYLVEIMIPAILFGYAYQNMIEAKEASGTDDPSKLRRLVGQSIFLKAIHFGFVAIGVGAYWSINDLDGLLGVMILVALFFNVIELSFILYSKQKLHLMSYATIVAKLVNLGVVIWFVQDPSDQYIFLGAALGANAFVSLITFLVGVKLYPPIWPARSAILPSFKGALPYGVFIGISSLCERLDLLVVKDVLGLTEMGIYTGVYKLYQSLYPVVLLIPNIFFAESLAVKDRESEIDLVKITIRVMMVALLPIAVGSWLVSDDIVSLVIGPGFEKGLYALNILISSTLFLGIVTILIQQIFIKKDQIVRTAIIFVLFLPCLWWGYPVVAERWGLTGVAVAVLSFKAFQCLLFVSLVGWRAGALWKEFLFGIGPTAMMAGVLFGFCRDLHFLLQILIGAVIYGTGMMIFHRSFVRKLWS